MIAYGSEHPAFLSIKWVTKDIVKSYRDDVMVHDRTLIQRFPGEEFFYFFRESGTHLIPVGPARGESASNSSLASHVIALMDANAYHFFWDGNDLRTVSKPWIVEKLKTCEPLLIQL